MLILFESIEITTSYTDRKLHRTESYICIMGIRGNLFRFYIFNIKTGSLTINCRKKERIAKEE